MNLKLIDFRSTVTMQKTTLDANVLNLLQIVALCKLTNLNSDRKFIFSCVEFMHLSIGNRSNFGRIYQIE